MGSISLQITPNDSEIGKTYKVANGAKSRGPAAVLGRADLAKDLGSLSHK